MNFLCSGTNILNHSHLLCYCCQGHKQEEEGGCDPEDDWEGRGEEEEDWLQEEYQEGHAKEV